MIDCESIILENGKKQIIVDKITKNDITYIYMVAEDNEKEFCIKKQITDDGKKYIIPLKNSEEFDEALFLFKEKNN